MIFDTRFFFFFFFFHKSFKGALWEKFLFLLMANCKQMVKNETFVVSQLPLKSCLWFV